MQAESDQQVKKTFFCTIFNTKFNLGFGRSATDACLLCIELKFKIKYENDPAKKYIRSYIKNRYIRNKMLSLSEHREDMITLCFDCKKNLPLPKIPDSITYYSKQLYFYNFTITEGCSLEKLNKKRYHWPFISTT